MIEAPWEIPKPKRPELALIDPETRSKLFARCGGLDEVTGERLGLRFDVHHRKKKSQGRDDRPCNLLVVTRKTHDRLGSHEAWARDHGFVVSAYKDPADVAVLLHCRRYVLLTDAFGYLDGETGNAA